MSLKSMNARDWHESYERCHPDIRRAVDRAFAAAQTSLKESGFASANDDRAETFVAAIIMYLTESMFDQEVR